MVMANRGNPNPKPGTSIVELFAHDRRVLSTKIQQEELLTAGKVIRGWYGFSFGEIKVL